jgi:hypothetical protein
MGRRKFIYFSMFALALAISVLIPEGLFAADKINTTDMDEQVKVIREFLFGTPMTVVAIFGCVYGVINSMMGGTYKPLIFFGGTALASKIPPKCIDALF